MTEAITGIDELDRMLGELESGATRIAEKATFAAAGPYQRAIKAAAPGGPSGNLGRSVGRRRLVKYREGSRGAKVGLNVALRGKKRAPHANLVTLGTAERWTGARRSRRKGGALKAKLTGNPRAYRGRMPADNFVRRATASAEAESETELRRVVNDEIEKIANR